MRQLLHIDCYECLPENIVVLVYTDDPLQTQPTENSDAGHTIQIESKSLSEEDSLDECCSFTELQSC
ncbi:hypothetical protein H2248_010241 [Termitomyces sp. 'cryptogamus']|nr:hypothetical protein H2248_010241 [Termitomyces sp. 'cryptogamus']